jgi:hypothetical protein
LTIVRDFRETYRQMTDTELAQVLADQQDLVPEAVVALKAEAAKRHVSLPTPQPWMRHEGSSERVNCLEDNGDYVRIRDRRQWVNRWGHIAAIGPFVAVVVLSRTKAGDSNLLIVAMFASLAWAIGMATFGFIATIRFTAYKCPQCSDRFGGSGECRACGFPRRLAANAGPDGPIDLGLER